MKQRSKKLLRRIWIFRALFDYMQDLKSTQTEILKGIIFNNTIQDSEWLKYKSFSPGEWAADYGLLYTLYRVLNGMRPQNVLEFGLGQSSKMLHQYGKFYNTNVLTCEHDEKWIEFFTKEKVGQYDLNIKKMELETISYKGFETLTYKNCVQELGGAKYDLIVVDGPFGRPHYSRPQILEISKANLSESFCIIIDDTHRSGESETANEVQTILESFGKKYLSHTYSSSKKHTLICSEDLRFLTSL